MQTGFGQHCGVCRIVGAPAAIAAKSPDFDPATSPFHH
jgi:hypothetical protein